MKYEVHPPQYLYIALDVAERVAKGELKEGSKVYGRSTMASEYGVSPETIRRAMKLLADMGVIKVVPKSGVYILSAEKAGEYIKRFGQNMNTLSLRKQLQNMLEQHQELGRQIMLAASKISMLDERAIKSLPFLTYEIPVPAKSAVIGKSIMELRLWQHTGCTLIAIYRGEQVVLSPGPYAQVEPGDSLLVVGETFAVDALEKLLNEV